MRSIPADRPRAALALVAAIVVVGAAVRLPSSFAQVPVAADRLDAAKRAFAEGVARYRQGDVAGAEREFERSYALVPEVGVLYNLGLCRKALGRTAGAHEALSRYLRGSRALPAERRRTVERLLGELAARLGEVRLRGVPDEARVRIDGRLGEADCLRGSCWLEPGDHVVELWPAGATAAARRKEIAVAAGSRLVVDFTTAVSGAEAPEAGPRPALLPSVAAGAEIVGSTGAADRSVARPIYRRWWFWTLIGLAAAGAAVGAWAGTRLDRPAGSLGPGLHEFR